MFHVTKLINTIKLKPQQIDNDILISLEKEVRSCFENKILGHIDGFVMNILKINKNFKKGIIENNGSVRFDVEFYAIVFIPKVREVLDIVIVSNDNDIQGRP